MASEPFDATTVHRHFSADCFNKAWELIDKPSRSPEEDEQMLRLNQASLWHWTQREDFTDLNLGVGYWQTSRIHALLNRPAEARRYGELSLIHAARQKPFYVAYAHEALARAAKMAGDERAAALHLAEASRLAEHLDDPEEKKLLDDDLNSLA